jgi:hypothetical protein
MKTSNLLWLYATKFWAAFEQEQCLLGQVVIVAAQIEKKKNRPVWLMLL